ncbi:MAG: hypothetical protein IJ463_04475 [Bacilli bacterium]|nr:hypothetical protein [Bacilli bacterium]
MEKGILRNDDIKFEKKFNEKFNDAYRVNPKKTLKYMELCTQELGYDVSEDSLLYSKLKILKFFRSEKNRMFLYCGLLLLFGICSLEGFVLYYFGMAFFCGGTILNLYEKSAGKDSIIFLFSHGLVGLIIMYCSFLITIFNYLPDSKLYSLMYLSAIICGIVGFFRVFLITLSTSKVSNKSNTFIYFVTAFFILALLNLFIFFGVSF